MKAIHAVQLFLGWNISAYQPTVGIHKFIIGQQRKRKRPSLWNGERHTSTVVVYRAERAPSAVD